MTKLIVALDTEENKAKKLVDELSGLVEIYKIGLYLFTSSGPGIVKYIINKGNKVFLDLKYYDIPNTVGLAVKSACELKVFCLTLHVSGGRSMLERAAKTVKLYPENARPKLFGVTVLTSMREQDLDKVSDISEEVIKRAKIAQECGLDGVVVSGEEIELVKSNCGKEFLAVVPGIRLSSSEIKGDDQKRILTPAEASEKGADFIVVGRPVLESPNPKDIVKEILAEIE